MKNVYSSKKAKLPSGGSWAELYGILLDLLKRRSDLLSLVKEFNLIDKALKQYFTGVKECSIGEFKIRGKYQEKQVYNLPSALKQKYGSKIKEWVVDIDKTK